MINKVFSFIYFFNNRNIFHIAKKISVIKKMFTSAKIPEQTFNLSSNLISAAN